MILFSMELNNIGHKLNLYIFTIGLGNIVSVNFDCVSVLHDMDKPTIVSRQSQNHGFRIVIISIGLYCFAIGIIYS